MWDEILFVGLILLFLFLIWRIYIKYWRDSTRKEIKRFCRVCDKISEKVKKRYNK